MDGKGYIVSVSPLAGGAERRMEKKEGKDVNIELDVVPRKISAMRSDRTISATRGSDSINFFDGDECIGWIHITKDSELQLTLYTKHFSHIDMYPE